MSDQHTPPTPAPAGQSATDAQGAQAPQKPDLNEDQLFSKVQSRVDKYLNERMKKAFFVEETPAAQPGQAVTAQAPAPTSAQSTANPLTEWAQSVETVYHVTLNPNDPEAAIVNQSAPENFRTSYIEALRQKSARLSTPSTPASQAPPIAPTTAGGFGGVARDESIEAMTARMIELQKNPSANMKELKELGAKLRAKLPKA